MKKNIGTCGKTQGNALHMKSLCQVIVIAAKIIQPHGELSSAMFDHHKDADCANV